MIEAQIIVPEGLIQLDCMLFVQPGLISIVNKISIESPLTQQIIVVLF
jgi:hypothetical protein